MAMTKLTDDQLAEKYRGLESLAGRFVVRSVERVNHKPHPFMVGSKAVVIASDKYGGRLGTEACDEAGCDWREGPNPGRGYGGVRCGQKTSAHTSDHVVFLSLMRELTSEEAQAALQALPLTEDGLDGVVLVETPERFQILPREPVTS